ncbi:hypothetical protein [Nocardioides taihuensis]|uniref:Uncharacterized protein n=1 Tax=Nocardioides taihuensis TaxID=1835606 RepID=A0ABW0BF39_9ACTN
MFEAEPAIAAAMRRGIPERWMAVALSGLLLNGRDVRAFIRRAIRDGKSPEQVTGLYARALATVERRGRAVDDFSAYAATPPGDIDLRVFTQGEVWVDIYRQPHRITDTSDLTDEYLRNLLGFLDREAIQFHGAVIGRKPQARDLRKARAWLEATPLMRTLREEAARRGV